MKVYGEELRRAAIGALERGSTQREVAMMLGVSVPTLARWRREHRQRGQVAPRARGHRRRAVDASGEAQLLSLLQEWPDATLEQHLTRYRQTTGHTLSRASLARAIVRLGWTRKKRV